VDRTFEVSHVYNILNHNSTVCFLFYHQMEQEPHRSTPSSVRSVTTSSSSSLSSLKDSNPSPAIKIRPALKEGHTSSPGIKIYPKKKTNHNTPSPRVSHRRPDQPLLEHSGGNHSKYDASFIMCEGPFV